MACVGMSCGCMSGSGDMEDWGGALCEYWHIGNTSEVAIDKGVIMFERCIGWRSRLCRRAVQNV